VGGNSQGGPGSGPGDKLCDFLKCVFGEKGVVSKQAEELLRKLGFDPTSLRHCLAECGQRRIPLTERAVSAPVQPAATQLTTALSPALLSVLDRLTGKSG